MKTIRIVLAHAFALFCTSQITFAAERFVSPFGAHQSPFTSWTDAATNIQDAIDVANAGDVVWVTNGVYSSGGKIMSGDLVNRVALDKALTVQSVNGADATIIQGVWDTNTNGPLAVRCAWSTNGATLSGFTLQGGATRTNGDATLQNGGGVWGMSTQAVVMNCWIYTNAAAGNGGGSFQASLNRCKVIGNRASNGGGVAGGSMNSSLVANNVAATYGGGAYECNLNHCTIVGNTTPSLGGGVYAMSATTRNSIFSGNNFSSPFSNREYYGSSFNIAYCCFDPLYGSSYGTGSISASPQFTDQFHLAVTSPCRGAGNALYDADTDFDGEPWLNPPSIGCDEVFEPAINGPLSVQVDKQWDEVVQGRVLYIFSTVTGRVTRATWSFGDGSVLTNATSMSTLHSWTNAGDYTVTFTAYNSDNTNGVSASTIAHVVPLITPEFSSFTRSGTNFTLGFVPQTSVTYYIERATNLVPPVSWQTVNVVYGASNYVELVDTKATNAVQFYRVRIR